MSEMIGQREGPEISELYEKAVRTLGDEQKVTETLNWAKTDDEKRRGLESILRDCSGPEFI